MVSAVVHFHLSSSLCDRVNRRSFGNKWVKIPLCLAIAGTSGTWNNLEPCSCSNCKNDFFGITRNNASISISPCGLAKCDKYPDDLLLGTTLSFRIHPLQLKSDLLHFSNKRCYKQDTLLPPSFNRGPKNISWS